MVAVVVTELTRDKNINQGRMENEENERSEQRMNNIGKATQNQEGLNRTPRIKRTQKLEYNFTKKDIKDNQARMKDGRWEGE